MMDKHQIITVDASNVEQYGFFCYKSKPKAEGYRRKLNWLEQRFAEGMELKIVRVGARQAGFIEYIPGEYAWRAVKAKGYLVVHCLWIVGRDKGKGYGSRLLDECAKSARKLGKHGVAMVTSSRPWLAGKGLALKNGFESVDSAPPSFELLVKRFDDAPLPSFPKNWDKRLGKYGSGLTVFRSNQCPYLEAATQVVVNVADELNIPAQVIELKTARQAQDQSPSAYGVFNIVYNGKLLNYRGLGRNELIGLLNEHVRE